ncbi:MAG: T9SS type A sorting domain-containing protein [Bacteroidota bacterium]
MAVNDLYESVIAVYPNPANNVINIRANREEIKGIRMLDLNGKVVLELERFNQNLINISNLKKGVYLLKINVNGIVETKKIIKY